MEPIYLSIQPEDTGERIRKLLILRKKRKSKMRKPECSVFLTYGPSHGSLLVSTATGILDTSLELKKKMYGSGTGS